MRPRVVLLRGHNANPWDLRPWERLRDEFDVLVLVTGSNVFALEDLELEVVRVKAVRDLLPGGQLGDLASRIPGDRYRGLEEHLRGADIVHSAELGVWFSGQPAALKRQLGFRLVLTVWETIPFRDTFRAFRGRTYRQTALEAADLFLAATDRARRCLLLEGAPADRIEVSSPGVDTERFAAARTAARTNPAEPVIVSPGRLVWEKGHYDVIRALALLDRSARLLIVGSGPERERLLRYAADLGVAGRVEIRAMPHAGMPAVFATASCVVLASLATPMWEEQFGMVLAEAMAAGAPIVASSSGAIPEVLGERSALFAPGDWPELARLLDERLADPGPVDVAAEHDPALVHRYSLEAAADRLRTAYARVLA